MRVTANFKLEEFLVSQTAARQGRKIEPDDDQQQALIALIKDVMQPIRDMLGVPIIITSGLRPRWLNDLIGGSETSQHMRGQACDFVVPGMTPFEVCELISENRDIDYDQLIHEFGEWIHISYVVMAVNRRADLTASFGGDRTNYVYGIEPV